MIRAYGLAAALICYARDAAAYLRSLAGNGRPASLDEHFSSVPRDPEPAPPPIPAAVWEQAVAEPTPLADAALDFLRRSKYAIDAMETVDDFLYLCGEDA